MCDTSEHAAGYLVLIKNYTDKETRETSKFASEAFGSKSFITGQITLTMYAKEFLAIHLAYDEFGHILRGTKKPIIVRTENKALTRFFQAKQIPRRFDFLGSNLTFQFCVSSHSLC